MSLEPHWSWHLKVLKCPPVPVSHWSAKAVFRVKYKSFLAVAFIVFVFTWKYTSMYQNYRLCMWIVNRIYFLFWAVCRLHFLKVKLFTLLQKCILAYFKNSACQRESASQCCWQSMREIHCILCAVYNAICALTLFVGHQEEHLSGKKIEWCGAGMVIWLEWGANNSWYHCHPTICCFIKIQVALTFLVWVYLDCHGKEAIKRVCVYMLVTAATCVSEDVASLV